jgi:hypothetical protein
VPVDGKDDHRHQTLHGRRRHALGEGLRHHDRQLRQHDPHLRGRHPRRGSSGRCRVANDLLLADAKKLKKLARTATSGRPGRRPGGPGRRGQGHLPRAPVQGPDQAGARHPGRPVDRLRDRQDRLVRLDRRSGGKKIQVNALREKMTQAVLNRVAAKAALEARARRPTSRPPVCRQAGRLPAPRPRHRTADRRGQLGRRSGQGRPRRRDHGRPAPAGQGGQRRQGHAQAGARQRRGPGADHRDRRRQRPGFRSRLGPLRAHHHPLRRRRRRQPHPLPAPDPHLPPHAPPAHEWPGLRRPAAVVRGQAPGRADLRLRRRRAPRCRTNWNIPSPSGSGSRAWAR